MVRLFGVGLEARTVAGKWIAYLRVTRVTCETVAALTTSRDSDAIATLHSDTAGIDAKFGEAVVERHGSHDSRLVGTFGQARGGRDDQDNGHKTGAGVLSMQSTRTDLSDSALASCNVASSSASPNMVSTD